jgi:hypothetical protein
VIAGARPGLRNLAGARPVPKAWSEHSGREHHE